ncbi:MFS transporter [Aquisediminimonas profunda]|uniref:MFS transporter n=1 Tax=Aquisediminimonas profunda TaxID=1550733 RepID=UPI001C62EA44|nr:MFS transporter [Aquisediminimonas profunda]
MAEMEFRFPPAEQPTLPGSPANPPHPVQRRIGYFLISILVGVSAGLGVWLIQANLAFIQGGLGLDPVEGAWLLSAYYMTNVTANLLLIKFRQQYGLQRFVRIVLAVYALSTIAHLLIHDFRSALFVRALAGIAGSGLITLTILYMMQAMPPSKRIVGAMVGICLPQLGAPLARVISPSLLVTGDWRPTYWIELGFALATLAAICLLPLPPSNREKAFERADFVSIGLLAPGMWLLVAVLSQGRLGWWAETPWIGVALAAAIGLIAAALIHEYGRLQPLIDVQWLGRREIARLMLIAAYVRLLLSEQSVGSIGLLSVEGMGSDQLVGLNMVILLASAAGLVGMVLLFRPNDVAFPIIVSVALIAIGSLMDSDATNLTRPANLYISQALIGFAAIVFLGSAMAIGIARTLLAGPRAFIGYVMIFSTSQSLGGLAGSAWLGTFEISREKFHSNQLVESIRLSDPVSAARVAGSGAPLRGLTTDIVERGANATAILSRQVAREAHILAYNDLFLLIFFFSILILCWGIWLRYSLLHRGEVSPIIQLQQRMLAAQAAIASGGAQ